MMFEDWTIDDVSFDMLANAAEGLPKLRRGDSVVVCRGRSEAAALRLNDARLEEAYTLRPAHVLRLDRYAATGALVVHTSRSAIPVRRELVVFYLRGES